MVWNTQHSQLLHVMLHHREPTTSLEFGSTSDVLVSSSLKHVVAAMLIKPTVEDVMTLWLDADRSPDLNAEVTSQLLASYPTLPNLKARFFKK